MFYLKMASQNIKKSINIFAPFILSSVVLYVLMCSLFLLQLSPVVKGMGSGAISLGLGMIVLTIFSIIMEIYSFNFLLKQRSREFGLYNMLGMNKKKVVWIATLELALIFMAVVGMGSVLAGIFANGLYLVFVNLTQYHALNFSINGVAFVMNAIIFAGIFCILELIAIRVIGKTSPLVLFRTVEKGEKEPKGNLLLALLSLVGLGAGYTLSLTSQSSGAAVIYRFFIAVLCVISGTYLFYISFITWYLKKRRKNKNYFYTPEHLVTTSQMIFRMKQHATGLANITLLAVMAFVTIATTTSLYSGLNAQTNHLYPKESSITYYVDSHQQGETYLQETVLQRFPEKANQQLSYLTFYATVAYENQTAKMTEETLANLTLEQKYTYFMTQDDFRRLGNPLVELSSQQVAIYRPDSKAHLKTALIGNQTFENVATLDKVTFPDIVNTFNSALIVVSDDTVLNTIHAFYAAHNGRTNNLSFQYRVFADLTTEEASQVGIQEADMFNLTNAQGETVGHIIQKSNFTNMLMGFTGGFLFTGFLLGISFLLGAALIMYYKQYAEGHEDRKSYRILQEVGMSRQAVKKTINTQTLMLFFMPLIMAIVHFVLALVMLRQILNEFGVTSSTMIYTVSAVTILVICALYYLIYKWTSRTYYRIIERKSV